jgi:hypothetical protein
LLGIGVLLGIAQVAADKGGEPGADAAVLSELAHVKRKMAEAVGG